MLRTYINYPNPHITIHTNSGCENIQQRQKKDQRVIRLNITTLSDEFEKFSNRAHQFSSTSEANDMWLEVEFGNSTFERAVVEYIRELLARHYSPFERISVDDHC